MENIMLVNASVSATLNAPIEKLDIQAQCFTLPESESHSCSRADCSAGVTTAPDGRRMSVNVQIRGGSPILEHYVEEIGQPDYLRLVVNSYGFTPAGHANTGVVWDVDDRKIDDPACEFTNTVQSSATPELMDLLGKQRIPWDVFLSADNKPVSEAHNRQETPLFAQSIERHSLKRGRFASAGATKDELL
jgi:hypothetical protein